MTSHSIKKNQVLLCAAILGHKAVKLSSILYNATFFIIGNKIVRQVACVSDGFSFSNNVGVEELQTGDEISIKINCSEIQRLFCCENEVASEGDAHRWQKLPVACRKGKP